MAKNTAESAFRLPPPCSAEHLDNGLLNGLAPPWARSLTARIAASGDADWRYLAVGSMFRIHEATESPIEQAFMAALFEIQEIGLGGESDADLIVYPGKDQPTIEMVDYVFNLHFDEKFQGGVLVSVAPQVRIDGVRVDFLITLIDGREGRRIIRHTAVECDGHDFHERTKEQAARDKSRDRDLLRRGIATVRFTGSELHANAMRCAVEALRTAGLDDAEFGPAFRH